VVPDDYALDERDRDELRRYLADLGADPDRIERAEREGLLGPLAVEIAVGATGGVAFADSVATAGSDPARSAQLWRALGFPDPEVAPPLLLPDEDRALAMLASVGTELLGLDTTLTLARLIGSTTSRLADALVDAFRTEVEVPGRTAGTPHPDMVRSYVDLIRVALPQLQETLGACLRRHLIAAAAATWTVDEDNATARRDLVVGFVDLVGWTPLSRSLPAGRLAHLVQRFEQHLADAAAPYDVRVVKLLGDGAMVVCDSADPACAFALRLAAAVDADEELPPVRVGLAAGQVVTLNGDHHGPVVNLAARLCAAAPAGGVLADDEVRSRATASRFGPAAAAELRGFPGPVSAAVVLP
jgi:adenylate cyclase